MVVFKMCYFSNTFSTFVILSKILPRCVIFQKRFQIKINNCCLHVFTILTQNKKKAARSNHKQMINMFTSMKHRYKIMTQNRQIKNKATKFISSLENKVQ